MRTPHNSQSAREDVTNWNLEYCGRKSEAHGDLELSLVTSSKLKPWAGERAQYLRPHTAVAEDLGSISRTHTGS